MMPCRVVSADEGKNGLRGPPPSSVMLCGGVVGLTILYLARSAAPLRAAAAAEPAAATVRTAQIAAKTARRRPAAPRSRLPAAYARRGTPPATDSSMRIVSSQRDEPA